MRLAITLRRAGAGDLQALAALSGELGYPVTAEVLGALASRHPRTGPISASSSRATGRGAIVGWIHGAEQTLLEAGTRCEIFGLV
jgi:hypothetical protein